MNIVGILLITVAVLAVIDVVIYIVLGAIEKQFKEDKDDER